MSEYSESDEEEMVLDIDIGKNVCGNCNQVASILLRRILVTITNRRTDDDTPPQYILVSTALLESFHLRSREEIDVGLCQECAEVFTIFFNSQREFGQLRGNGSVVDALITSNHFSSPFKHRRRLDDKSLDKQLTPRPLVNQEIELDGDRSDEDFRNNYFEEDIRSKSDNSGESEDDYAISPTRTSKTNTGYPALEQLSSPGEFCGGRKAAGLATSNIKKTNGISGPESDELESGDNYRPNMRNGECLERKRIKIEGLTRSEGNNHLDAEAVDGSRQEISDDGDETLEDSCDMIEVNPLLHVETEYADEDRTFPKPKYRPGPLRFKKLMLQNGRPSMRNGECLERKRIKIEGLTRSERINHLDAEAVDGSRKEISDDGDETLEDSCDPFDPSFEVNPLLHVETEYADEDRTFPKPKYRPGPLRFKKLMLQNGRPKPGPRNSKSSSIHSPAQCIKEDTNCDPDRHMDTYEFSINNLAQDVKRNGTSDSHESYIGDDDDWFPASLIYADYSWPESREVCSPNSVTRPRTECPACSNTYYKLSTLRKHYSKVHGGTVPDSAFSTLSDDGKQLQEASSSQSTRRPRNQCPACSNTYCKISTLKLHYEKAHRADAPNFILPC